MCVCRTGPSPVDGGGDDVVADDAALHQVAARPTERPPQPSKVRTSVVDKGSSVKPSLDDLWLATGVPGRIWRPGERASLPEAARRYLEHAIAPGTMLASAVRLRMHGEIKLTRWAPFRAEQVTTWNRGMVWTATVRVSGLPVRGYDRLVNGQGEMRWRLLGLIPVMAASGPDISRSAAGRVLTEAVWLPSVLAAEEVRWTTDDASQPRAQLRTNGDAADLALTIDSQGGLQVCALLRWGNPGGGPFRYVAFGAMVDEERRFGGYTIPSRLRVGWYIGTDRFEREGEFFRVTVDSATYR